MWTPEINHQSQMKLQQTGIERNRQQLYSTCLSLLLEADVKYVLSNTTVGKIGLQLTN